MPGDTTIEWAAIVQPELRAYRGRTWNPTTGCTEVSPGCDHCYARTFAERFRGVPGHAYEQGFDLRLWEDRLDAPLKIWESCGYFVNSMSDWCHEDIPEDFIMSMFRTMCRANWHIYQLLTKRAPRMVHLVPQLLHVIEEETGSRAWPSWIWMGVTCESYAQKGRLDWLRRVPAPVRFVSYEPALSSPVQEGKYISFKDIAWVIGGAESGHGARPMSEHWMRDLRDLCKHSGTSFFLKQNVVNGRKVPTPMLDGKQWMEFPDAHIPESQYHLKGTRPPVAKKQRTVAS